VAAEDISVKALRLWCIVANC